MKEMSKSKIIDKRSEKSVKNERDLLSKINHPFIINMHFSFQDNDNLYLVMDLLTGGDLRYHICKNRKFTEEQSKFFIACILLGLEYCHKHKIIHRDIKPENLVLDSKGYVHITDFGIAKIQQKHNYKETSGTPGYMSPEVMFGLDHTILVDYFAIGVMGFEFMKGYRPYLGKNRKEIKEKIISHQAHIKKSDLENNWTFNSADFINKMLIRKPCLRLGYRDFSDIKNHDWFKNYPWKDLYKKNVISPFIPLNGDNFDRKYCNAVEKNGVKTLERYSQIIMRDDYKSVFNDYYYFNRYSDVIDNVFENFHEIIYGDNIKKGEFDEYSYSTNYSFRQISQDQVLMKNVLVKKKNLKKLNNENMEFGNINLFENFISQRLPKKKNSIHIKATSSMSVGTNQAFFEANNYINDRKMKRNQSLVNNCVLGKGNNAKNFIHYERNSQHQSIQNNNNNSNEISLSKKMKISQSTKLMKISK